jgi:hypothetical protein
MDRFSSNQQEDGYMEQDPLETTLGDFIVALTEETSRFVRDEREAYKIVAFILTDLLRHSGPNPRSWH